MKDIKKKRERERIMFDERGRLAVTSNSLKRERAASLSTNTSILPNLELPHCICINAIISMMDC